MLSKKVIMLKWLGGTRNHVSATLVETGEACLLSDQRSGSGSRSGSMKSYVPLKDGMLRPPDILARPRRTKRTDRPAGSNSRVGIGDGRRRKGDKTPGQEKFRMLRLVN